MQSGTATTERHGLNRLGAGRLLVTVLLSVRQCIVEGASALRIFCTCAGILFMQLALTTAVCAIFMTTSGVQSYMQANSWPLWTSMGVSFGVLIAMLCNIKLARAFPHNYIMLTIFTAAESVMIGTICMVRLRFHFHAAKHSVIVHKVHNASSK